MTSILIADSHEVVRRGLRDIIETQPGWGVVAEAADGKHAIEQCVATSPNVAILDYTLPLISGLEATRQMRRLVPTVQVLIFTLHKDRLVVQDLIRAGARAYVLKSDPGRHMLDAVQCLAAGRPFFSGTVLPILLDAYLAEIPPSNQPLSPREQNVVQLVAEGHSNKQIARVLNIGVKTVETHRATILRKLDVSTAGLVRYAIRNHLVQA